MGSKNMEDITRCVICGRNLQPDRDHVDTCDEGCYKRLLDIQRRQLSVGADN